VSRVQSQSDSSLLVQTDTPPSTATEARARHRAALAAGRARRQAARSGTPDALPGQAPREPGLGTTGGYASTAGQSGSLLTRDGRYTLRETLTGITADTGLSKCGRAALGGGVTPVLGATGAHFAGLVTCGKVHLCPVCSAKIRAARAAELDRVAPIWESRGRGFAMMTLTIRHYRRMPLGSITKAARAAGRGGLLAVQHDAWRAAFSGGRPWRELRRTFGVIGYVRTWEVTHGANGWHPHWHVGIFTAWPWSPTEAEAFAATAHALWAHGLERAGGYRPGAHGVRVDVAPVGDTGAMARYLVKDQAGKARIQVGAELHRSDLKDGRGGSRTPFQIALDFQLTGDVADVDLWREYEVGTRSVRAMHWSAGMRALLAELVELEERSDEEIAQEEAPGEALAVIPAEIWYRHVIRHRGRSLALLRAAEALGAVGVRTLVESWGLVWGRDVLPPPPLE
jgi:hypothetical protein